MKTKMRIARIFQLNLKDGHKYEMGKVEYMEYG